MIKKNTAENDRRARNIIWNAASDYDLEPSFLAYFPNGEHDLYFDMIIGLAYKWLDIKKLEDFFAGYESDRRSDEFDAFLWLGLENCLYEKEYAERPVMEELRRERAERFFRTDQVLSRQQMMYQSMPVHMQQEIRWSRVSGRGLPVMTPREKRMAESLRFSGELDTDEIVGAMTAFLLDNFRYDKSAPLKGPTKMSPLTALFRHEHVRKDRLIVRNSGVEGAHPKDVLQRHTGLGRFRSITEKDEEYIREVFGKPCLDSHMMRLMEAELCREGSGWCRLWVVKAGAAVNRDLSHAATDSDIVDILQSRSAQAERNRKYLADNMQLMRGSVKKLSAHIETVLAAYLKHLPEKSRRGRIMPERAYRLPLLQDASVFRRDGDETENRIFVDILLDASQSRMHAQEALAAEAYIIAESLIRVKIPVRVCAFRSLRGFTVLEILKPASDRDCMGIMDYYAGGWNRDSVAIGAAGSLVPDTEASDDQRMLLVLTDASPNDSAPLISDGRMREYEGAAAVKETEDAIKALRDSGFKVGAVFHGNPSHLGNAHQIYGNDHVQIRKTSQLAQGVGDLLLKLMRC